MKTKHTKGEWKINQTTLHMGMENIIDENGHFIAHIDDRKSLEETGANAKLIAAAPDMLEALNGLLGYKKIIDDYLFSSRDVQAGEYKSIFTQAEQAIKKATA